MDAYAEHGPLASGLGDFNGDGATDLVYVEGIAAPSLHVHFASSTAQQPHSLTRVREGADKQLDIEYVDEQGALGENASENRYTKNAICPAHSVCARRAPAGTVARVVTSVPEQASEPSVVTVYNYADAQRGSDGWLGFGQEVSKVTGSSSNAIYKRKVLYHRPWIDSLGRHVRGDRPDLIQELFSLDDRLGAEQADGQQLARLVSTVFQRGWDNDGATEFDPLRTAYHLVHEEHVSPGAFESNVADLVAYFDEAPISYRLEEHGMPDEYGNPTSRLTTLYSTDDLGSITPVAIEGVAAGFIVSPQDVQRWTVSAPSRVEWTVVGITDSDAQQATTVVESDRGVSIRVIEYDAAGTEVLSTSYARDGYGNTRFVTETDPLQAQPRSRELIYGGAHVFPERIRQTVQSPVVSRSIPPPEHRAPS